MVERFLKNLDPEGFAEFRSAYRELLDRRFAAERQTFDALAELARTDDVYLGCNCPTAKQPDVTRCHTSLALAFMKEHYPDLEVRLDPSK